MVPTQELKAACDVRVKQSTGLAWMLTFATSQVWCVCYVPERSAEGTTYLAQNPKPSVGNRWMRYLPFWRQRLPLRSRLLFQLLWNLTKTRLAMKWSKPWSDTSQHMEFPTGCRLTMVRPIVFVSSNSLWQAMTLNMLLALHITHKAMARQKMLSRQLRIC